MFQIKIVEEIKTRILGSVNSPPPPPPKKIMSFMRKWKNAAEVERPQTAM
jgi:hypothetical protein